jgi:alkyl hydroperoxide reductase subunit AhpC
MNLKLYISTLFIAFLNLLTAQDKAPITIKLKTNLPNSYCLLANHFGSQKYKVDSIVLDSKGNGNFKEKKGTVKGGIYMFVFPTKGNQYVEVILSGKEKNIEVTLDSNDFSNVSFKNSEENDLFYADVKYLGPYQREVSKLSDEYKTTKDTARKKILETQLIAKEKELLNRRLAVINTKGQTFYSRLLNLMRDIDVPEPPKKANGTIDSNFKYYYFKNHYWDFTDFNDDRLLYTPIFENKFKYYFEKLVIKHPDTLKKEVDYVLNKIKDPNSDMMRYCLASLLNDYANSKIMGQDALYVHIVHNYYARGKAPWTDSATLVKMKNDADDLAPVLIGKTAPNFAVFDTTWVNYTRLYDLNKKKYKLVAFWSADCGHCKKEIPQLDSIYPSLLANDCDVFSVSTVSEDGKGENKAQLINFLREKKFKFKTYGDPDYKMNPLFKVLYKIKGTPEYFILDEKNIIIAKKLGPDQALDFIINYKKYNK